MHSPVLLDRGFASTEGRELKARKIEAVVADFMGKCGITALHILDIGCDSGHIAAYFAHRNRVTACVGHGLLHAIFPCSNEKEELPHAPATTIPQATGQSPTTPLPENPGVPPP